MFSIIRGFNSPHICSVLVLVPLLLGFAAIFRNLCPTLTVSRAPVKNY